jgi:cell division protein FtsB
VESLKTNLDAIEEKARKDLGMIKQGEVFYLVTDEDSGISKERRFSEEKAP